MSDPTIIAEIKDDAKGYKTHKTEKSGGHVITTSYLKDKKDRREYNINHTV